MNIVVTHAYSTTNSGDGLLVEEAVRLIGDAIPNSHVTVLALDPGSFTSAAINPFTDLETTSSNRELGIAIIGNSLRGRVLGARTCDLLEDADLIVAVGGGYLRGPSCASLVKTSLAHLPQLPTRKLSSRTAHFVYLPQSIGPFPKWYWPLIRRRLRRADSIHLRDDRSVRELGLDKANRTPDLAILGGDWRKTLDVARSRGSQIAPTEAAPRPYGLVARDLGRGSRGAEYDRRVRSVHASLRSELLLQAHARGNDDAAYYERVFGTSTRGELRTLRDATRSDHHPTSVVVSVRLHGALESIRNGTPAVHLSYERKGWGAYEDLGISKYVHNAFAFDPEVVAMQAIDLARDPEPFWRSIEASVERIGDERLALIADIRRLVGTTA